MLAYHSLFVTDGSHSHMCVQSTRPRIGSGKRHVAWRSTNHHHVLETRFQSLVSVAKLRHSFTSSRMTLCVVTDYLTIR